jgi:hypothetical protein
MAVGKKTGGRVKGTPNKATAEIKDVARQHGPQAIAVLARLMVEAESEQARVAAANAILDRGYGKPSQHIDANVNVTAQEDALDQLDRDERA